MDFDQITSTATENALDIQTCSFLWLMENKKPCTQFILPKGSRFEIVAKFSIYVMDFFVKLIYPENQKGYMKASITLLNKSDQIIDKNESEGYFDDKTDVLFKKKNWMLSHGEPYGTYRLLCEFAVTLDQYSDVEIKGDALSGLNALTSNEANLLNPIIKDFQAMYEDQKMTDVMLQCGEDLFHAHKFVLAARSPVFCSIFSQKYFEEGNNVINISDLDSSELVYLLKFMYGKELDGLNYDSAKKLSYASHKYVMPSLKQVTSKYLSGTLNDATVCEILLLSDTVQDIKLKSDAISYIKSNSLVILSSSTWKQLQKSNFKLAQEALKEIETKNKSHC